MPEYVSFGPYNFPLPAKVEHYTNGDGMVQCVIDFGHGQLRFVDEFHQDTQGVHWFHELADIVNTALDSNSIASIRQRERARAETLKYVYKWLSTSKEFQAFLAERRYCDPEVIAYSRIRELAAEEPLVNSVPDDQKHETAELAQKIAALEMELEKTKHAFDRCYSEYEHETRQRGVKHVRDKDWFVHGI